MLEKGPNTRLHRLSGVCGKYQNLVQPAPLRRFRQSLASGTEIRVCRIERHTGFHNNPLFTGFYVPSNVLGLVPSVIWVPRAMLQMRRAQGRHSSSWPRFLWYVLISHFSVQAHVSQSAITTTASRISRYYLYSIATYTLYVITYLPPLPGAAEWTLLHRKIKHTWKYCY